MINPYIYPGIKDPSKIKFYIKYKGNSLKADEILEIIANNCGTTVFDIVSKNRKMIVVDARHIFCGIMKIHFGHTYKKIGESIGQRDHTTAIHSVNVFKNRCELEQDFRNVVDNILYDLHKKINLEY
jgi:chromosomal replication initiator protein